MNTRQLILSAAVIASLVIIVPGQQSFAKSTHTALVSANSAGEQGNGTSTLPFISADGKQVAFESLATNLTSDTVNGTDSQVFLRNLTNNTRALISKSTGGAVGLGDSTAPTISSDGTLIAFESTATNLDGTTTETQIFLRNTSSNTTILISKNTSGDQGTGNSEAPYISADGKFVTFQSSATNLDGTTTGTQVFLRDLSNNTTTLISKNDADTQGDGTSGAPSISADGAVVAFQSDSSNFDSGFTGTQIYVRDRNSGTTTLVSKDNSGSHGNGTSVIPIISADGRYVVFTSNSTNLVVGTITQTHVYLHDRTLKTTSLLSRAQDGTEGNGLSYGAFISPDGRYVAFTSQATNLIANDNNGWTDIFVRDVYTNRTTRASVSENGEASNNNSSIASISTEGKQVAFDSVATNLTSPATSGQQVFVRYEQGMNILFMVVPALAGGANTP